MCYSSMEGVICLLEVVLYALEILEGMRRVLLCLLEVPEVMRCVTL